MNSEYNKLHEEIETFQKERIFELQKQIDELVNLARDQEQTINMMKDTINDHVESINFLKSKIRHLKELIVDKVEEKEEVK